MVSTITYINYTAVKDDTETKLHLVLDSVIFKSYYAALLPRMGPHIASHSVCLSVCLSVHLSVCLSIRPVIERHVAPPSELQ